MFEFDIDLKNLTDIELGALLWLLQLEEGHYMRLGLGKPLGFGSVRVELDSANSLIADGKDWIESLRTWNAQPTPIADLIPFVSAFEEAIGSVNPELLPSFRRAASGFGQLPIHYPRLNDQLNPIEHFQWFVENEKGHTHYSLPDLLSDVSLPSTPS